ncbi:MAG: GspH/FimT family pseudopilin, partial [Pseudomonadota bacterium]
MPFVCHNRVLTRPFVCFFVPFVRTRSKTMGFTLIELIVTIAIVGILLAWAIPNFRTLIMNQRLATSANDFIADTSFARSEAVKRGGNVGICVSS